MSVSVARGTKLYIADEVSGVWFDELRDCSDRLSSYLEAPPEGSRVEVVPTFRQGLMATSSRTIAA